MPFRDGTADAILFERTGRGFSRDPTERRRVTS
jgi:hypothetical protein